MKTLKEELITKYQKEQKEHQVLVEQEKKVVAAKQNERELFHKFIKEATDYEPILNEVCEKLKNFIGATGVYVAIRDNKRRAVTEQDDENAHIVQDQEVIRYIAWCEDHQELLKGKYIELNNGVTNFLFDKPAEDEDKKADDKKADDQKVDDQGNPEEKKIEEEKLNQIKVDEVVREKRMKFFREPRLGCYRGIDITYKSSLLKIVY